MGVGAAAQACGGYKPGRVCESGRLGIRLPKGRCGVGLLILPEGAWIRVDGDLQRPQQLVGTVRIGALNQAGDRDLVLTCKQRAACDGDAIGGQAIWQGSGWFKRSKSQCAGCQVRQNVGCVIPTYRGIGQPHRVGGQGGRGGRFTEIHVRRNRGGGCLRRSRGRGLELFFQCRGEEVEPPYRRLPLLAP